MLSLIQRAHKFPSKIAIISEGRSFTYRQLLDESHKFSMCLLKDDNDLMERRVAFVVHPGFDYVMVQWAIWRAGGIAVPLNPKAPVLTHKYALKDAGVNLLVISPDFSQTFQEISEETGMRLITTENQCNPIRELPEININRKAMILYTSGTTGSPKGVVATHANIEAQILALVESWKWSDTDYIINVLPLHHVHGIINIVSCALWSGAICEFTTQFNAEKLMTRLSSPEINIFMAVPTIYFKLISYWKLLPIEQQEKISDGLQKMRLMVSGSAALPISVLEKWFTISGHILLERYGMTEIGMAISNPYDGKRVPGHIGRPLPNVEVRLVDDDLKDVGSNDQGEILIKGPNVFKEYWGKPDATREAFTEDGWFKTGDIAINNGGNYKIIGRRSIDIIKSGGYKLSALEIEEVLREYELVTDCAVVGIPDEEWGEIVAVGLVIEGGDLNEEKLRAWASERLAGYKIPRLIKVIPDLPRNAMGKVVKMELKEIINSTK